MNAIPPKRDNEKPTTEPQATEPQATQPWVPVLATRLGRGRVGGSTVCDMLIQRARRAGRPVMVADGDRRNPTLAGLYPPGSPGGASVPATDELADMKDWITEQVGQMVSTKASLVLDLGGGDRVLSDYGQDLPLATFCQAAGVSCLPLYFSGPEKDDFDHIIAIHDAGYFRGPQAILFLNESLVRAGKTTIRAFDPIMDRPDLRKLMDGGVRTVLIPRLPCMAEMRATGLNFYDAAANKPGVSGKPMDPVRQFMVKIWLERLEEQFIELGVAEWLP